MILDLNRLKSINRADGTYEQVRNYPRGRPSPMLVF
jgi:hypothetical protein